MKNMYIVSNHGMLYSASQLILQWIGLSPKEVLYTSYKDVHDELDSFLFGNMVDKHEHVIFIGFNQLIEDKIRETYNTYTKFKFINNNDDTNPLIQVIKKIPKDNKLTENQKKFIKYVYDFITMSYTHKEGYYISCIFRSLGNEKFNSVFNEGYNNSIQDEYSKIIKNHIIKFRKLDQTVFEIDGVYFVNSTINFLDDYLFFNISEYGNLSVVDVNKRRLYMRKHKDSPLDILKFCNKYCSDTVGYKNLCSANITKDFLEYVKNSKIVK